MVPRFCRSRRLFGGVLFISFSTAVVVIFVRHGSETTSAVFARTHITRTHATSGMRQTPAKPSLKATQVDRPRPETSVEPTNTISKEPSAVEAEVRSNANLTVQIITSQPKTTIAAPVSIRPQTRPQFIFHRCPTSFNITDQQDQWFRSAVVQRGPGTAQVSFTDEILVLTPICNAQNQLRRYFENLCSLVYPHRLLTVVLGEDSSTDRTVQVATDLVDEVRPFFKHVELIRLPTTPGTSNKMGNDRHDIGWQLIRRRQIATARNRLLSQALGLASSAKWVLWLDVDVRHIPRDLIRHLLSANQSIVVPNCLWRQANGQTDTFDRNTWRETNSSLSELRRMSPDALMLEGYSRTSRLYLNDLKTEADLVQIDGVGGCVLLINAELHRSGLVFPPFVFDHHIETEGLAKMAARMGVRLYGLPSVNVIHW